MPQKDIKVNQKFRHKKATHERIIVFRMDMDGWNINTEPAWLLFIL